MPTASSFPFISGPGFGTACRVLVHLFNRHERVQGAWESVTFVDEDSTSTGCLRITKTLDRVDGEGAAAPERRHPGHGLSCDFDESDEEALVPAPGTRAGLVVEYNILLSPVYRVPVLYFFLHGVPCTIETLYEHLVPAHSKGQAQDVGIMGGISMSTHPVTGTPAFFVHPCNTAEALKNAAPKADLKLEEYLLLWLGIVGECVGLTVPLMLAEAIGRARPEPSMLQTTSCGS